MILRSSSIVHSNSSTQFLNDILIVASEFIIDTNPLIGSYSMTVFSRLSTRDRPGFNSIIVIDILIHMSADLSLRSCGSDSWR
jgi:hypothetical protein